MRGQEITGKINDQYDVEQINWNIPNALRNKEPLSIQTCAVPLVPKLNNGVTNVDRKARLRHKSQYVQLFFALQAAV